jgi:SET domain-containing protein
MEWKTISYVFICVTLGLLGFIVLAGYRCYKLYNTVNSYSPGITVKKSNIESAGNGVFGEKDFKQGDIIEICPIVVDDKSNHKNGPINDYFFDGALFDSDSQLGKKVVLPLGYGGMFNHSDDPNCTYMIDNYTNKMIFAAKKDIKSGEEIFIDYGSGWWNTRDIPKERVSE